jgi:hypothetical protein
MANMSLCVALALSIYCLNDASAYQVPLRARILLQDTVNVASTRIRVADLSSAVSSPGDVQLGEEELKGIINVTSSNEPVMYGAYFLGPSEVAQINHTVSSELVCLLSQFAVLWGPGAVVLVPDSCVSDLCSLCC